MYVMIDPTSAWITILGGIARCWRTGTSSTSALIIPLLSSRYPYRFASNMPAQSTEQSFRDNLSQFRWARGNNDDSEQTSTAGANPFSRFYNAIGNGYVPLRSSERSNEEEAYFALSRWERYVTSSWELLGAAVGPREEGALWEC